MIMARMFRLCMVLLLLGACGGGTPETAGPLVDETLERLASSAHRALEMEQAEAAARLYARALTRARERDDPAAIADMAYGQATAALAHGDAPGALSVAQEVRGELARRGRRPTPGLLLAEATALHRLDRTAEAGALASAVVERAVEDPPAAQRATFLLGLIAAGRGDLRQLAAARAAMGDPASAAFRADAAELEAHAALLRGNPEQAATRAAAAAALRQEALDYRGLSRALALQGRAVAQLGDAARAADLLLRAGRGAAERGERRDAQRWLAEAQSIARRRGLPMVAEAARRATSTAAQNR